jgi:hypothetical protein
MILIDDSLPHHRRRPSMSPSSFIYNQK